MWSFSGGAVVKNLPANTGATRDPSSSPESGRSPGIGNGNSFQYSWQGNPVDTGAWQATVHHKKGCTLLNCWAHCRLVWVSTQLHCYLIHFIYVFTLRVITLLLYCRVHTLPKAVVFVFIFTVCPLYFSIFSWPSSFLYLSFGLPSFLPIFRSPSSNLYF